MTTTETRTPLHRLAAVLRYLDAEPSYATVVPIDEIRALLVGDQDKPAYVAVSAAELAWLRGVHLAAEVVAAADPHEPAHAGAVHSLRSQLNREPKAAA